MSRQKQAAVAIAQEAETVVEGEAVALVPALADQGGDQQQQGALGLVEVGDQPGDDAHLIRRCDHEGCGGLEARQAVEVEVVHDVLQGLGGREGLVRLVGEPLLHVERAQCGALFLEHHPDPIEALEGARAGGADGHDGLAVLCDEVGDERAAHDDGLGVHGMLADGVGGHGAEGAGPDVQRHLVEAEATLAQGGDEGLGEVEPRRGGGHGAVEAGEDGLVTVAVGRLGVAVQVRRQRDLARRLEHRGEGQGCGRPAELDVGILVVLRDALRREGDRLSAYVEFHRERALLPAFGVADETSPTHGRRGGEGHLVVLLGLKAKHLDARACGLVELQAGADDLGLVEDQQGALGQEVADVLELRLLYPAVLEHQQLGGVALGQGVLGDAVLGQRVVVGLNSDVFYSAHLRNFPQI